MKRRLSVAFVLGSCYLTYCTYVKKMTYEREEEKTIDKFKIYATDLYCN